MAIHVDVLSRLDESAAEDVARQLERHMDVAGERAGKALTNAIKRAVEAGKISEDVGQQLDRITERAEKAGKAIGAALVGGIVAASAGLVEIGEKFEAINRGLMTTTTAAGQQLANLNEQAKQLAGTMDISMDKIGTTMGQISSQLGASGPALKELTETVGELSDRFKGLNTDALIGGLVQMHVPAEQANEVLASLTHSAREFGGVMPEIATGIAQYGAYFKDLGLNAEQAGHMIGELARAHIPLTTAMSGLQAAQKANVDVAKNTGQPVMEFSAFVERAARTMEEANRTGNTALRDQIALLVFGQRKWIDAKVAADDYLETLRAGPNAYKGNVDEMNRFFEATRNLHNEFQRLKNQIALTLEPVAHEWVNTLVEKLQQFGTWAQAHQEDLKNLFHGAAEVAGTVITVLERITEILGEHPGLIEAVVTAFIAWEAISGIAAVIRDLTAIATLLRSIPALAAVAGEGMAAGLATAGTVAATIAASLLAAKETMDYFSGGAAGNQANQTPKEKRSFWDTVKTWMTGDVERDEQGRPKYGPGSAAQTGGTSGVPQYAVINGKSVPLDAQGKPMGVPPGWGAPAPPSIFGPGTPFGPKSYAPGAEPGGPEGAGGPGTVQPEGTPGPAGMVWDGQGGLLTPDMFQAAKKGKKGKLPQAPEIPYPAGYGGPPEVGETEQHYTERMNLMEKQHKLAEDQARLDQLEKSNVATEEDIQKEKNKIATDRVELYKAEARANEQGKESIGKTHDNIRKLLGEVQEGGGGLGGLGGLVQNLTKTLLNVVVLPLRAAIMNIQGALPSTEGAAGLIGIGGLLSGMGGAGRAGAGGAGQEHWTGSGWAPAGAAGATQIGGAAPGQPYLSASYFGGGGGYGYSGYGGATLAGYTNAGGGTGATLAGYTNAGGGAGGWSLSSAPYGMPHGANIPQGAQGFPPWVYAMAQQFGLTPSTYPGHQETGGEQGIIPSGRVAPNPMGLNRGIDWFGSQANMDAFAAFLQQSGLAEQVIHYDPTTGAKYGFPAGVDYSGNWGEESTMVHTRFGYNPVFGPAGAGGGGGGGGGGPGVIQTSAGPIAMTGTQHPMGPFAGAGGPAGGGGPPNAPTLPGGGQFAYGGTGGGNLQQNKAAVYKAFMDAGGNPADFPKLDYIIMHESGYDVNATNPKTGDWGIPQFNPAVGNIARYLPTRSLDPYTQGAAMLRYITDRYARGGDLSAAIGNAYAFKTSQGTYGSGGEVGGNGAVPIIAHSGEHVITRDEVDAAGGHDAMYAWRAGLHYQLGGQVPQAPPPPPAPTPPPRLPGWETGSAPALPAAPHGWHYQAMPGGGVGGTLVPDAPAPPTPSPDDVQVPVPPGMQTTRQLPHMPASGPGVTIPEPGATGPNPPQPGPGGPNVPGPTGPPAPAPTPPAPEGGPLPAQEPIGGGEPMAIPGPGIGLGGGLIGLAESAPGMAASTMGAPFGGAAVSAAMQIGMQELNRAIGFAGQVAGIGVQGLMETFLPAGVSKLASENWITRIAAGVSGAKPQLPNIAGGGGKAEDVSKGLTPEQLAALPPEQQPGGGKEAGPAQNQPAAPLVHIDNFHSGHSINETAAALNRHVQAANSPSPVTGSR